MSNIIISILRKVIMVEVFVRKIICSSISEIMRYQSPKRGCHSLESSISEKQNMSPPVEFNEELFWFMFETLGEVLE